MGLNPQQRQQRQADMEAAEQAAAHSNWSYPWPPAGDDSSHPVQHGDALGNAPEDGRHDGQPGRQTREVSPHPPMRSVESAGNQLPLWKSAAVSAAIAGCVALLWKWRR